MWDKTGSFEAAHFETETAQTIAAEPRNKADKPLSDIHIQRIEIARCAK